MNDEQKKEIARQKEVIRQESFWFAATTLGFIGFVGALLKKPSLVEAIVTLVLIFILTVFTIYLLVERYKKYCELNGRNLANWWSAFGDAVKEKSGTLYCIIIVTFSGVGFFLIILMRILP